MSALRQRGPAAPGAVLTRDYEFHLRLAAKALLDVGNALTYTEAAARARSTAGRGLHGGIQPNGSLVAEWIAVFAPLLVREHAETCWPETVLVDSTNFIISSTRMGTSKQAFAIVAVYGCAKDSERGKLLGLYATHEHFAGSHGEAFAYFEALGNERSGATGMWTPPTMVLTDGEWALVNGMILYWKAGPGPAGGTGAGTAPYAKRCEWHLRKNAKLALKKAGITSLDDPIQPLLDAAFQTPAGWDAFCAAAQPSPHVARYVTRNHELRVDDLDHYTEVLREAARAAGGRIEHQRRGYCTDRAFDLRP